MLTGVNTEYIIKIKKYKKMLALLNKLMYTLFCCDDYNIANNKYGPLAHLVEHLTLNQGVRGSSPRRPTLRWIDYNKLWLIHFFATTNI